MSTYALAITPELGTVQVSALSAATARRDELLADASTITTITDQLDADSAAVTLRSLKEFAKQIEAAKKDAKAPIIALGKQVDATAAELTSSIEDEASRIGSALGAYDAEERRKADEERRKAEAEAARIRREADEKAREVARKAESVEDAARKADEIQGTAAAQVHSLQQHVAATAAPKRADLALRKEVQFEVTDIGALYADNPTLVKLEPNTAAIKAIIKANPNIIISGLRHWTTEKF